MRRLLILTVFLPALAFGQNRVQQYVDGTLKLDGNFQNAVVALLAVDESDNVIASWNETAPLVSASTMKLVTAGAALKVLGPEFRFKTSVAYTGEISDTGVLDGDLYIVGGGDPTLGSSNEIAFPIDSVFDIWASAIENAGIRVINGKVVGDDRFFEGDEAPDEWAWGDTGYYYGSSPGGLSFAENLSSFEMMPGKAVGDPVTINPVPPVTPGMVYDNKVVTGVKGSGDKTTYYATELSLAGRFGGTLALGRKTDTLEVSNKFAALTCASAFASYLSERGVLCEGVSDLATASQMNCLCETFSPTLEVIVKSMNTFSNNFYAEAIFRTLAKALSEEDRSDYASAARNVSSYVSSLMPSNAGYHQYDGSGLAPKNYISPKFMCSFLGMMASSAEFDQFFASLPSPGGEGTLKSLLANESASVRSAVHAKSGSATGVRCYAGYVSTKRGLLRFAIMANNFSCSSGVIISGMEKFMSELVKYGNFE